MWSRRTDNDIRPPSFAWLPKRDRPIQDDRRIPDEPGTRAARFLLWVAWAIAGSPFILAFRADEYLVGLCLGCFLALPVAVFVALVSLFVRRTWEAWILLFLAVFGWFLNLAFLGVALQRVIP